MKSCSSGPSTARNLTLEQLEHAQRAAERCAKVDARRSIPHGSEQLARVCHSDLGRARSGVAQGLLKIVGNDDARQLVVETERQAVARDRKQSDQQRDGRLAAEAIEEPVEVLEVEDELRHRELRAVLDLPLEAVELELEVVRRRIDCAADEERRRGVNRSTVEVLAGVQLRDQLDEPDGVDLVNTARA